MKLTFGDVWGLGKHTLVRRVLLLSEMEQAVSVCDVTQEKRRGAMIEDGKMKKQTGLFSAAHWIVISVLFGACGVARSDESAPRHDEDGSSAGATRDHDPVVVEGFRNQRDKYSLTEFGVQVYTSAGSTGARFGRNNASAEFRSGESDKEKSSDEEAKLNPCDQNAVVVANPVVLSNGNKVEPELDFAAEGEWPLYLARTYNLHWEGVGLLGYKWLTSFDYRLSFNSRSWSGQGVCYAQPGVAECQNTSNAATIWLHHPDGSQREYSRASDGVYYGKKTPAISRIVRQGDGTWMVHGDDNMVEVYSKGGYPLRVQNAAGIGWTFQYGGLNGTQLQRVVHTSGRAVTLVWAGMELRQIRGPNGNEYSFTYAAGEGWPYSRNMLSTVTYPGANPTVLKYHYSGWEGEPRFGIAGFGLLTGKSISGQRYSWFTYSTYWVPHMGDWRTTTTSSRHANDADKHTFEYTVGADGAITVVETNPLGFASTYQFKDDKVVSVTGAKSAHCEARYKARTYDANGYEDEVVEYSGAKTNFDYDAHGHLMRLVHGVGSSTPRSWTYVWDESRNLVSRVTMEGVSRIDYTYTDGSRVAKVAVTDLVSGQMRETNYTYTKHPNGLLATATIDGPLPSDTVTHVYSALGDLVEMRNGLGHRTQSSAHDSMGRPGRVVGPTGDTVDFNYDARGRVVLVRTYPSGSPVDTRYVYGASGLLDAVQSSDGNTVLYHYDAARRLIQEDVTAPGGGYEVRRTTYNAMSQPVRVEVGRD